MRKETRREYGITAIVVLLCLAFFALGVAVPIVFTRSESTSESTDRDKFNAVYDLMANEWFFSSEIEDIDQQLLEKAIEGMTSFDEDPHTEYFDLESAQNFSSSLEGSGVGLGLSYFVNDAGNLVVQEVFLDSPAENGGLRKGDEITQVGDLVCSSTTSDEVVSLIQENADQNLHIEYIRNDQTYSAEITPTQYDNTVICNLYEEQGYAEIILTSFSETSGEDFAKALERIEDAGITNLLLDLRNNTGGYLSAAVDIGSLLLPSDSVIFQEVDKDGNVTEQRTDENIQPAHMERIVILQNGNTASASEALIGALKDNLGDDIVTLVGTTSYGKGTEQTTLPFSDGTSIKYTIAKWLTPDGDSIHGTGFEPDIKVGLPDVAGVTYSSSQAEETVEADTVRTNARAIQTFLQYLGYDADRTDEYFSLTSSRSLRQFQSENGLEETGNCDPDTWTLLLQKAQRKYNEDTLYSDAQRDQAVALFE